MYVKDFILRRASSRWWTDGISYVRPQFRRSRRWWCNRFLLGAWNKTSEGRLKEDQLAGGAEDYFCEYPGTTRHVGDAVVGRKRPPCDSHSPPARGKPVGNSNCRSRGGIIAVEEAGLAAGRSSRDREEPPGSGDRGGGYPLGVHFSPWRGGSVGWFGLSGGCGGSNVARGPSKHSADLRGARFEPFIGGAGGWVGWIGWGGSGGVDRVGGVSPTESAAGRT